MTWDPTAFRTSIQSTLDAFVEQQGQRLAPLGEDAARFVAEAKASVTGGKRLRAAFCYWGFRALREDPTDEQPLLAAAAALELLHASALVHDDVIDASDTRRGRPATHRAFEAEHRDRVWSGNAAEYGVAGAILLGDLLLAWSDELLRTCGLDRTAVGEALTYFDATRSEVITGQFLDVSAQARGRSDVEQAMRVLRYKSAKYSVERPLHVGAALAGGSEEELAALSAFGLPLGEAFQLRDDLLGVFGDPQVTGKPAGDDLSEGKRTVLVALALQQAAPADAARLEAGLGTRLSEAAVTDLRRVIVDSGAAGEVEKRIDDLARRSLEALDRAPVGDTARAALRDLADAATRRDV